MRFMTSITAASICLSMTNINTASADSACVEAAIRSHFELMEYCKAEFYSLGSRVPGGVSSDPARSNTGIQTTNNFFNYTTCENTAMTWYLIERDAC
jgi:hypothetical protein